VAWQFRETCAKAEAELSIREPPLAPLTRQQSRGNGDPRELHVARAGVNRRWAADSFAGSCVLEPDCERCILGRWFDACEDPEIGLQDPDTENYRRPLDGGCSGLHGWCQWPCKSLLSCAARRPPRPLSARLDAPHGQQLHQAEWNTSRSSPTPITRPRRRSGKLPSTAACRCHEEHRAGTSAADRRVWLFQQLLHAAPPMSTRATGRRSSNCHV
jgi:hypothetical protein